MGRLSDWWRRFAGRTPRRAAFRPPPEARFTEIGTNYPSASSTSAPTWSAPNPYTGFATEPSLRSAGRGGAPAWGTPPSPTGAAASSAPSTTGPAATPSPAQAPPANPYAAGAATALPRGRRARSTAPLRTGVVVVGVLVLLVVVSLGLAVGRLASGSGSGSGSGGSPPGGYAPELDIAWSVEADALTGDYGGFGSADGSIPGAIHETATGWVVMAEPSQLDGEVASLDPDTGEVRWSVPMPEARCTATGEDTIVCLTREGGSQFQLVTLAAEDGQPVGDPVPTDLTHVPVVLVPLADAGLVTFTMDARLTALDLDGSTLWSEPIDLRDYEPDWLQPDVASYGSSTILHLGTYVGTVQASAEGAVVHDCRGVAVTPEAWLCTGDDTAVARAPDGTELWQGDWQDYYLVDQYEHIAPMIIVDNWDGSVSGVDPLTGDHGPAVPIDDDRSSFNLLGDPEHPFVFADASIHLLDADLTTVLWSAPIEDEYLNIASGGIVGDTLAIDAEHSYGFDVATGDMKWERAFLPYDSYVVGEAFVGMRATELMRYELP